MVSSAKKRPVSVYSRSATIPVAPNPVYTGAGTVGLGKVGELKHSRREDRLWELGEREGDGNPSLRMSR